MATKTDARHKSRLIREMARDLNRHDHSVVSSTGSHHGTVSDSTVSDFDPEHEAIMSTRQMDMNSQQLPKLRDTAKKYGRWNGGRQPDFVINTSAIGRAFPDFSQGGSSDDSMEIEIGRGAKTRQRTPSRMPRPEYSNDDIDSPIVTIGDFRVLNTPPIHKSSRRQTNLTDNIENNNIHSERHPSEQRASSRKVSQSQRTASSSVRNQTAPRSNTGSPALIPGYVSGATRTATGEVRRGLGDIHARVADESEASFVGDERPTTVSFAQKHSRFSNFQAQNSPLSNVANQKTNQVTDAMVEALAGRRKSSQAQTPSRPQTTTMQSSANNATNQSFLLPSMPEISELVAGSYKDGTPVFTKNGQVQSRFVSNASGASYNVHNQVDSIPVPGDEKAIFLSLQLLQDKVAELEMENANIQKTVEDLQRNNYQLQAENEDLLKRRRTDSALGMADSGSEVEHAHDNQKLVAEKIKLESQIRSVQDRLLSTERMVSTQDSRLRSNTAERDQAIKQLAEAFNLTEQLKAENASLREANQALRNQLAQLLQESEQNTRRWQSIETALHEKITRRDGAISRMREVTRDLDESQPIRFSKSATTRSARITRGVSSSKLEQGQNSRGRASAGPSTAIPQKSEHRRRSRSRSLSQARRTGTQLINHGETDEEDSMTGMSDQGHFNETTKTIHKDLNITAGTNGQQGDSDTDFSSILGDDLIRMRQQIAENRRIVADKEVLEQTEATQGVDNTGHSVLSARSVHGTQREASGLIGILKKRPSEEQTDRAGRVGVESKAGGVSNRDRSRSGSHHRRHSETSVKTTSRRRVIHEDMTSAFILPDITVSMQQPVLSESARRKLDQICQHDAQNCTICSRITSFQTKHGVETEIETKKTVRIEKPIPVSERMPEVAPYEEEPTMRPANAPGLALATVIQGLEDEIAHLKIKMAQLNLLFNQHDPSLGMRKRKKVSARIDALMKEINRKCDQLYALYDVLEGQKQSGQEMSEKELDITLQSIGVTVEPAAEEKKDEAEAEAEADEASDDDSELDLPWEGIDDTTSSNKRQSWRL